MSSNNSDNTAGACFPAHNGDKPSTVSSRNCTVCGDLIPEARLKAIPTARQCVPCLEQAGDVPLLRRLDEVTNVGTVETYFFENPYAAMSIRRSLAIPPPKDVISRMVGDDTFDEVGGGLRPKVIEQTEEEIIKELSSLNLPFWSEEDSLAEPQLVVE